MTTLAIILVLIAFGIVGYVIGAAAGLPPIEEEDEHCTMVETKKDLMK